MGSLWGHYGVLWGNGEGMGSLRGHYGVAMGSQRGPIVSLWGPMGSYGGLKGLKSRYRVSLGTYGGYGVTVTPLWGP